MNTEGLPWSTKWIITYDLCEFDMYVEGCVWVENFNVG